MTGAGPVAPGRVRPLSGAVLDTNVFVAAGFNPRSASARILAAVRSRELCLIWNRSTRHETALILRRIPRLDWSSVETLFQPQGCFTDPVDPEAFAGVPDPDDRKFAALAAAAACPLVTSDDHLLGLPAGIGIDVLTPHDFVRRRLGG